MRCHRQILTAASAILSLLTACGTPGLPTPPSLELATPVADLSATRKGDRVLLTWTPPRETTDRRIIKHPGAMRVCRSINEFPIAQCANVVGQAAQRMPADRSAKPAKIEFSDLLPESLQQHAPTGLATYAIEVMNARGRSAGLSNQVRVALVPTWPPPSKVKAQVTADGVLLGWPIRTSAENSGLRRLYHIYRQAEDGSNDAVLAELSPDSKAEAKFVDRSAEWEKIYLYRVTAVSRITGAGNEVLEVEGADSPPLKVFVHDIFPPAAPSGVQAVFSGVGQQRFIDLTWAPNTENDLAGYNVYRREAEGQAARVNADLVKTPAFRDANVAPGRKYFYSVSAVDLRGNESAHSVETSESVPE